MSAPMEIVLSADSAGQLWNCAVLELHSGTNLLAYRGGNTSSRSLTVLNGEYILGAQLGKNFINVWEIQRKDQLQQKIVCPGIVTCLTASPNGLYLVAGIADAIYLWEVSSGNLLAILSRHYQDLTCLRFSDDSSHFISGGKDNLALVWSLASVVQLDPSHTPEPRHVLSRHSLPITDIHCGLMGPQARVATASLDQTVKLWELSSGEMLLSVLFDVGIMSVTLDPCEYYLFCGGSDGGIFQVSLCSQSLSRDKTFQSDNEGNQVFKGHRNLVTCVSVSMDGTLLLSGSHDETIRLWDIQSKQSVRSINHKGFIYYTHHNSHSRKCTLPTADCHLQSLRADQHCSAADIIGPSENPSISVAYFQVVHSSLKSSSSNMSSQEAAGMYWNVRIRVMNWALARHCCEGVQYRPCY
uniref:WD repeat domain 18 n=1 Tax=Oncorhynchus kisutch TaxID=8019 RepID=A0A8C7M7X9_ONCKI